MNSATWASGALNDIWTANGGAGTWAPEPGNAGTTTLSGTKPNHQYFCFIADPPCFPSTGMVTKADGTRATVAALKEGDAIVATTDNGTITTDTVSFLSIAKPKVQAPFVVLQTAAGPALTLTMAHHVPVGSECCSNLKLAKDITIGETVWTATVKGQGATATTVTDKTYTSGSGLHSPVLTHGSFPIVDGVVTAFDSIDKVSGPERVGRQHAHCPRVLTCARACALTRARSRVLAHTRARCVLRPCLCPGRRWRRRPMPSEGSPASTPAATASPRRRTPPSRMLSRRTPRW